MSTTAHRENELLDALALDEADNARRFAGRIRRYVELAELSEKQQGQDGIPQFLGMEIAGTTRRGRVAADHELADALRYAEALPLTLSALSRGELFEHQARTVLKETRNCTVEVARHVEARVLPDVLQLAPPDLRRKLKKAILQVESELDSEAVAERLEQARADRRVWANSESDGMASVGASHSAEVVQQFLIDLDRLVQQEKVADRAIGVWRSADQIRADLTMAMPGMLLAQRERDGVGSRALPAKDRIVNVFVPVTTLLERGNEPGEISGYGPISAEHVRLLRTDARFRRVFVDTNTGQPIGLDSELSPVAADTEAAIERVMAMLGPAVVTHTAEPQHDPSPELRRFVEVRDLRCRGVGCSHPASKSHKDHLVPYPEGPTAAGNLGGYSANCHGAKHNGWTVLIGPDGSTTWISPLGRRYTRPPAYDPPMLPRRRRRAQRPLRPPLRWVGDDDDEPLLLPPEAAAEPPSHPRVNGGWDDEPPF